MTRFFNTLLILMTVLCLYGQNAASADTLKINSLRIGSHFDKTRIVVELSESSEFRVFMLEKPNRLVIDLEAFDWEAGFPSLTGQNLVSTIRNGVLETGISRIVLELTSPAALKTAFILPRGPSVSNRVVIDLIPSKMPTIANTQRIFGNLKSGGGTKIQKTQTSQTLPPSEPENTSAPTIKGKKPLIVIDAGHGGQDPGAIGDGGEYEKKVTLAAAKELKKQLEATGRYRVHLTRDSDKFVKLPDRVKIARTREADLFISLHADSIDNASVSGASIYTLSNKASDAQTEKLAARENRVDLIAGVDLSHEDKQVANILIDLAMRDTMNQSKFFANLVVKQAGKKGIRLLEKPHRYAGFAVLKAPDIPSVLVEMGFMSNKKEVALLTSADYRQKMAASIAAGIDGYFSKVHKNGL